MNRSTKSWRVFWLILLTSVAVMMLANAHPGPDFNHYVDWVHAFRSGDIGSLKGDVLSPMRVPLSQWSFGPGMITSISSPLAVGLAGALVFWVTMHRILLRVTGGDQILTLFGLGVCFVGTPLGFYSTAVSSETLSYTCLGLVVLAVIETRRWGPLEAIVLSVPSALLLTLRPQLGLYLVTPLVVALCSIIRRPVSVFQTFVRLVALGMPLLVAVAEIMVTNRWMTGSFLRSPYSFGGGGFESIDFARPEIAAVLVHPWHGLLAYHPLYALLLTVPVLMAGERRPTGEKFVLLAMTGAALVHLYLHASWYVWWLGNSFGLRGMGIASVFLVPLVCKYIAERRGLPSTRILVGLVLLASAWSALLLLQGATWFYTYEQLWLAQINSLSRVPLLLGAILGVVIGGSWFHRSQDPAGRGLALVAYGLCAVVLFHLVRVDGWWTRVTSPKLLIGVALLLPIGPFAALLVRLTRRWQEEPKDAHFRMTIGAAFGTVFIVSTALFIRLAIGTEVAISERSIALDRFHFRLLRRICG